MVPKLEDYQKKYSHLKFRREDGILEVRMHTDGSDLVWAPRPHEEMGYAFEDIARDPENKVVILTGSGETFIHHANFSEAKVTPAAWQRLQFDARRLLMSHLDIEVPMIAAINGPATVHAELGLLCDIVLASEKAVFADAPHSPAGLVPGDGVHVIWPLLLGMNRGRYFLLTGQRLSAREALDLGVVNEVVAPDQLLRRAWELARMLRGRPEVAMRFTRTAMVQMLKKLMLDNLGYGLALEGIGALDYFPSEFTRSK